MSDPVPVSAISTIGTATVSAIGSNGSGGGKILSGAELRAAASLGTSDTPEFAAIRQTGTGAMTLPSGTTAQRPTGSASMMRWNTTTGRHEFWTGAAWDNHVRLSGDTMTGDLTFASARRLVGTESSLALSSGAGGQFAGYVATTPVFSVSTSGGFRVSNDLSIGWANFGSGIDSTPDLRLFRGGAGILQQRNGLNAQTYELFETFTSTSNYGSLRLKATASGHQIGSARGTSGANRAVQLGHFDAADAFTSGLSIATNGTVTASSGVFSTNNLTAGKIDFGPSFGAITMAAGGQIAFRSSQGGLAGFIIGNTQGAFNNTTANMVIGNLHASYFDDIRINGGGTFGNNQTAGSIYLHGGSNYQGGTNSNGGSAYLYPGAGSGSGVTGKTHLAWDGSAEVGRVLVGTGTDDGVNLLQVAGSITASGNLNLTALPTSDPGVPGRVWRDGTNLRISV